jgi:hypothetical protein
MAAVECGATLPWYVCLMPAETPLCWMNPLSGDTGQTPRLFSHTVPSIQLVHVNVRP